MPPCSRGKFSTWFSVEPVPLREAVDRRARVVAEVLVVDRVELDVIDEVAHVRVLDHDDAVVGEERGDAGHHVVEAGNVGHDVVGDDDVGALALGDELGRELGTEEPGERGNTGRVRGRGLIGRGVDAEHRHAELGEVLQQVTVVARDLDDEARRTEPALGDETQHVLAAVAQQLVGERREVEVVVDEHLVGRHLLQQLDERAVRAERDVEREALLELEVEARGDQRVGQRRLAEREERVQLTRAARAALGDVAHCAPFTG